MTDEKIRIKRNINIINSKTRDLWDATSKRNFDDVYQFAMELAAWIVNCDEWFFKNDKLSYVSNRKEDPEVEGILLGLRQVFNSFKHNMSIISVEEKKYIDFFKTADADYKIEQIAWLPSIELDDEKNSKAAYQAYQNFLEGKSVLETFQIATRFLGNNNK